MIPHFRYNKKTASEIREKNSAEVLFCFALFHLTTKVNAFMKTLIVLLGPTGVGKTDLSLSLAEHYHSPIISSDSRQMYAPLKIGTAAPTEEQLQRVKHYFVGTLQVTDYYSAARYEEEAMACLTKLFETHDTLILSGGSMMYIDAVCNGIDDIPTVDEETRAQMMKHYEEDGLEALCQELKLLDPEYYNVVDLKNPKRVIHALEICYMTGRTYTSYRTQQKKERPFRILKIGLTRDREELYNRINRRVEIMMEEGLLEEARAMYPQRQLNALNTVGYKEMFQYLDGTWDLPFAIEKIKQNSRIYSRKQMTWFRRDPEIHWFHPEHTEEIFHFLHQEIEEKAEE
jgi:tRNA dimethylallyltransferase